MSDEIVGPTGEYCPLLTVSELAYVEIASERDAAIARAEMAEREVLAWTESARWYSNDSDYYRGIVDKIGELLGIEARTQDDGNVVDGILRAKVYELVKIRLTEAETRISEAKSRLAERDASARRWVRLGCVLALLLPFAAHAADAPPTPPQAAANATPTSLPAGPPLQSVTLSADDYRLLINSRVNELVRQDPVAQMLIVHQNAAQAKAKGKPDD
jgi:hypothetical protein